MGYPVRLGSGSPAGQHGGHHVEQGDPVGCRQVGVTVEPAEVEQDLPALQVDLDRGAIGGLAEVEPPAGGVAAAEIFDRIISGSLFCQLLSIEGLIRSIQVAHSTCLK